MPLYKKVEVTVKRKRDSKEYLVIMTSVLTNKRETQFNSFPVVGDGVALLIGLKELINDFEIGQDTYEAILLAMDREAYNHIHD